MSIKAMTYVWEHSEASGTELLCLLAIADNANDAGEAYPGIARLAKKCRVGERAIQKVLRKLEESGELEVRIGHGLKTTTGHTNRYVLLKYQQGVNVGTPHQHARGEPQDTPGANVGTPLGVNVGTPKPSVLTISKPSEREGSAQSDTVDEPAQPRPQAGTRPTKAIQSKANAKGGETKGRSKQPQTPPPIEPPPPSPRSGGKVVRINSPYLTDPRRFVNGFIPNGTGTNQIEIYYERFDIRHDKERLSPPIEDDLVRKCPDLDRFRAVIEAYSLTAYQRRNIKLILDWYRDGIPDKNLERNPTYGTAKAEHSADLNVDWAATFGNI